MGGHIDPFRTTLAVNIPGGLGQRLKSLLGNRPFAIHASAIGTITHPSQGRIDFSQMAELDLLLDQSELSLLEVGSDIGRMLRYRDVFPVIGLGSREVIREDAHLHHQLAAVLFETFA